MESVARAWSAGFWIAPRRSPVRVRLAPSLICRQFVEGGREAGFAASGTRAGTRARRVVRLVEGMDGSAKGRTWYPASAPTRGLVLCVAAGLVLALPGASRPAAGPRTGGIVRVVIRGSDLDSLD